MRINVYAEELPDERVVERVETRTNTGRTFFGARIFLKSPEALHDKPGDDDRSAVTFWGPRDKVARLLRAAADAMDGTTSAPIHPLGVHSSDHYRCPCLECFSHRLNTGAIDHR